MLKQVLEQGREAADAALERLLPPAAQHPTSIHQAMRHSVFAGGKRLRPGAMLRKPPPPREASDYSRGGAESGRDLPAILDFRIAKVS